MSVKRSQPNNDADAPPKKSRAGCVWACIALVFCLVLLCGGVWVCLFVDIPLKISEETTYITEPLTADGRKVDYFAAMELEYYPEDRKTDDNGYRLIVKNLGPVGEYSDRDGDPAACKAQSLEKLGLEPSDIRQPTLQFQGPYAFLEDYVAGEEFDESLVERLAPEDALEEESFHDKGETYTFALYDMLDSPWTLDNLPMMARWLEENGPALDLIGQAARKPSFCIPIVRVDETGPLMFAMSYAEVQAIREFARALNARAYYRIGVGDIDGAIDDILACKRLGRHVGQASSLLGWLVGMAIEGMANSIGVAESLGRPPTEVQLQRLFDEWEDVPPSMAVNDCMRSVRYEGLEFLQGVARGDYSLRDLLGDTAVATPQYRNALSCDWNLVAKRINEYYDDHLEKGGEEFDWLGSTSPKMLFLKHRSRAVADNLGRHFLPALGATFEANRRIECSDNLHRITLAMLIYERQHGALPPAFTVDAEGRPLHSWRVPLLPYLGQQELYDKIRLDEPWDSQHNRQFHEHAVSFYQCPTAELDLGQTNYSVVVGPDMPFEGGVGKSLADFGPRSGDMILVVERAGPVCWMNPTQEVPQTVAEQGINVNSDQFGSLGRPNDIASGHPGGVNCGHRDGAVRFLPETMDVEALKKLLNGTNDSSIY